MTTKKGTNPSGLLQLVQEALVGVQQELPAGSSLQTPKGMLTQAQIEQTLTGYVTVFQAAVNQKTLLQKALLTRKATSADARAFLKELKVAVTSLLGSGNPAMAKFGMATKTPSKPTAQTQVVAAAKRVLTRQKRGTMGSKAKSLIKTVGTPELSIGAKGVTITPSAADAGTPTAGGTAAVSTTPVVVTTAPGVQTTLTPVVGTGSPAATVIKSS